MNSLSGIRKPWAKIPCATKIPKVKNCLCQMKKSTQKLGE